MISPEQERPKSFQWWRVAALMGLALSVFTLFSRGALSLEMAAIVLGVAVIVFVIFSRLPKRDS